MAPSFCTKFFQRFENDFGFISSLGLFWKYRSEIRRTEIFKKFQIWIVHHDTRPTTSHRKSHDQISGRSECVVRNNSPEQLRNLLRNHKWQFGGANDSSVAWWWGRHLIDLWLRGCRLSILVSSRERCTRQWGRCMLQLTRTMFCVYVLPIEAVTTAFIDRFFKSKWVSLGLIN